MSAVSVSTVGRLQGRHHLSILEMSYYLICTIAFNDLRRLGQIIDSCLDYINFVVTIYF